MIPSDVRPGDLLSLDNFASCDKVLDEPTVRSDGGVWVSVDPEYQRGPQWFKLSGDGPLEIRRGLKIRRAGQVIHGDPMLRGAA